MPAGDHVLLGGDDLLERPAEVHRAGAGHLGRRPRDRPVERPVELEHPGPVAVAPEPAPVAGGQAVAREPHQLARARVEQHGARVAELGQRVDRPAGLHYAAERAQVPGERVRQPLGAAAHHRPADGVRAQQQHEPEGRARSGAQRSIEWAAQPPNSARARSPSKRERASPDAERIAPSPKRAITSGWRGGRSGPRISPISASALRASGPNRRAVCALVLAQPGGRRLYGALEHHRGAVVEGMCQRRIGMHRLEAVLGKRQLAQEGRRERQRMDGRAGVVHEPGKRQLLGPAATADRVVGLVEGDSAPVAGERDRARQPVRARPDDYGVVRQPLGRA